MNKKIYLHVAKREDAGWKISLPVHLIAVLLALVVCGIITALVTGLDPISVYAAIFDGAVGTSRRVWATLQNTAVLLCVSLAVTPAFRMKFWNVGGEGQVLAGSLAAASCMILLTGKVSNAMLYVLMAVTSVAAGAFWAFIPAVCKAKWNTNETLSTLMMNYIAKQLVAFFVVLWENPKGSGQIGVINSYGNEGWFPAIAGQKYLLNVLITAVLLVLEYVYLNYTKHGYEISIVGGSERTARYVGIDVRKVIIRTVMLSGALCGVAGLMLVAGASHTVTGSLAGGRGFTAVMVSWMAKFDPIIMILTSFLIVFLEQGSGQISTVFGLNTAFADIITGIIIIFIIGSEFFANYKIAVGRREKEEG